MSRDHFDNG